MVSVKSIRDNKTVKPALLLGVLVLAQFAAAQQPLLRLQRSTAELEINSGAKHAQGMQGITYGNPGDVWHYPNSLQCLVIYGDGKYVYEKRDEPTVGKPKVKLAEGSMSADELQQVKALLDDEAVKKLASPAMPPVPDDMVAIHEITTLNLEVNRGASLQQFMTVKERIKTNGMSGLDTWLDNGAQYQKTLTPLLKWFKEFDKQTKSAMKDSQPQYCAPMNIG